MNSTCHTPVSPNPMRRVLKNFGTLLKGRGFAAVLLLGVTILLARSLGPEAFGLVVFIETYALITRSLLNFKLFEAIVYYGVPALDKKDNNTLRRLIHLCWKIDWKANLVATVIAFLAAPLVAKYLDISHDHVILMTAYSLILLASTGNNTARGLLRLYDRFDIIGKQMTVGPAVRFIGVVIAWSLDSSLAVFIAILAIGSISEDLYLNWQGFKIYKEKISSSSQSNNKDIRLDEFPGLRHFIWVTYWQSNMDLVPKKLTVVLTGYLLGTTEAGLLRLASQFSSILSKPATLIRQVVFPDLTRSWHEGSKDFKIIAYKTALLGGLFGFSFVSLTYFFGDVLLTKFLGEDFIGAKNVMTLLLMASTLNLISSPLRSAAYAVGKAGLVLRIHILSTVIYLVTFFSLTSIFGLVGAGLSACVSAIIPPFIMLIAIKKSIATTTNNTLPVK